MIEQFIKPAVEVDAVHFLYTQECIDEIFHWLDGATVIRAGVDHELRHASELTEEGRVLNEAPPFLVIHTRSGENRVDVGDWIVRYDEIRISVYDDLAFTYQFSKKGED